MTNFELLLQSLPIEPNSKGKEYEKFAKWYLENEPRMRSVIKTVWMWENYPERWGPDRGIDLMCLMKNKEIWAVQVKCFKSDSIIQKADIDSFISESERKEIKGRILFTTVDLLSTGAKQVIENQEKKFLFISKEHIENSNCKLPIYYRHLKIKEYIK